MATAREMLQLAVAMLAVVGALPGLATAQGQADCKTTDVTFYNACPDNDLQPSRTGDRGVTIKAPLCQCVQVKNITYPGQSGKSVGDVASTLSYYSGGFQYVEVYASRDCSGPSSRGPAQVPGETTTAGWCKDNYPPVHAFPAGTKFGDIASTPFNDNVGSFRFCPRQCVSPSQDDCRATDVTFYNACPDNDLQPSRTGDRGVTIKAPLCQCVQTKNVPYPGQSGKSVGNVASTLSYNSGDFQYVEVYASGDCSGPSSRGPKQVPGETTTAGWCDKNYPPVHAFAPGTKFGDIVPTPFNDNVGSFRFCPPQCASQDDCRETEITFYQACPDNTLSGSGNVVDPGVTYFGPLCTCVRTDTVVYPNNTQQARQSVGAVTSTLSYESGGYQYVQVYSSTDCSGSSTRGAVQEANEKTTAGHCQTAGPPVHPFPARTKFEDISGTPFNDKVGSFRYCPWQCNGKASTI